MSVRGMWKTTRDAERRLAAETERLVHLSGKGQKTLQKEGFVEAVCGQRILTKEGRDLLMVLEVMTG